MATGKSQQIVVWCTYMLVHWLDLFLFLTNWYYIVCLKRHILCSQRLVDITGILDKYGIKYLAKSTRFVGQVNFELKYNILEPLFMYRVIFLSQVYLYL